MMTEMNIYHHCQESAEGRKIYCSVKSCWLGRFLKLKIRCLSAVISLKRVKGGQTMMEKSDGILFTGSISINKDIRCYFFFASWLMAERHRIHATSMQTPDESLQCPVVYLKPGLICRLNRIGNKKNAKAIACWAIRKKSLDGGEKKISICRHSSYSPLHPPTHSTHHDSLMYRQEEEGKESSMMMT